MIIKNNAANFSKNGEKDRYYGVLCKIHIFVFGFLFCIFFLKYLLLYVW